MLQKILHISTVCFFICCSWQNKLLGQGWEKLYGTSGNEIGQTVVQTQDLGFLAMGTTDGIGGGGLDVYFVKTDQDGVKQWEKTLGGIADDSGVALINTNDGGYAMIGKMDSYAPAGFYLIKLDSLAEVVWSEPLTGFSDSHFSIFQAADHSFSVVGQNTDSTSVYLVKTDANGIEEWNTELGNNDDTPTAADHTPDGGWVITGYAENSSGDPDNKEIFLLKTDDQGGQEWYQLYGITGEDEEGLSVFTKQNGGYQLFARTPVILNLERIFTIQTNPIGAQEEVFDVMNTSTATISYAVTQLSDNRYVLAFKDVFNIGAWVLDEDGNQIATEGYEYGPPIMDTVSIGFASIPATGGFALTTTYRKLGNERDILLVKADSLGATFTAYARGQVFADLNNSCSFDNPNSEYGFSNWIVQAQTSTDTFTTLTDADGSFLLRLETSSTTLTVIPNNPYWQACPTKDTFSFTSVEYDTLDFEFPFSTAFECPYLEVDIATPLLRRCFDNTYYVSFGNQGSDTAFATQVEVVLDSFLLLDVGSISIPYSLVGDSLVDFELGDLPPGTTGSFSFVVNVSCNADLGRTHCVSAHIFPDSLCLPVDPLWDTSSVRVSGHCEGDSVLIEIENIGLGDMESPAHGFIGQDDLIVYFIDFRLDAGKDTIIVVYPNGETLRMEAQQSFGHPGQSRPSLSIEGCGNGPLSLGYVTQFPEDDANPFISIDCRENVGSYDPNNKLAFPEGLGTQHIISHNTELEYIIRFQNTGTDTAFNIVIRDSLPLELDITTLQQGTASHNYSLEILESNVLKFTFSDIMLPDSNVNEPASHGFVKFRIQQVANNPPGTVIENRAGIYFDFNEPILTPTVFHTIEPPLLTFGETDTTTVCAGEIFQGQPVFTDVFVFDTIHFSYNQFVDNQLVSPIISDTLEVDTSVYFADSFLNQQLFLPIILSDTVRDDNGCDVLIVFYSIDILNSDEEVLRNKLVVYPNPTIGDLYVQLPEGTNGRFLEISILSLEGYLLLAETISSHHSSRLIKLPVQHLPAGMKIVEVRTEGGVFNQLFLKN